MSRRLPPTMGAAGGQLWVTGPAGARVEVRTAAGAPVVEGEIDRFGDRLAELGVTDGLVGQGGFLVRDLDPGDLVVTIGGGAPEPVTLPADEVLPADWEQRVRGQVLDPGYGYVETRDRTRLSRNVVLPDAEVWGPGPYPTLVHCSAYDDSRPERLSGRPEDDEGMYTEANVARLLGFAVVGVNVRGTGGSGGAFRMFDRILGLDGYDVVEAVAAQPWCGRVGLIGWSGPGFVALRIAATAPPSLAAVAPGAVLAQGFGTGRRPGGLVNSWVLNRLSGWDVEETPGAPDGAHPPRYRPGGWDDWVAERLAEGDDPVLTANQLLRGRTVPPAAEFQEYRTEAAEARTGPWRWVAGVRCPLLVIGSWQDQESGPGWADLVDDVAEGVEVAILGTNGTHEESRFPEAIGEWLGFLSWRLRGAPLRTTAGAEAYVRASVEPSLGPVDLPIPEAAPLDPERPVRVRIDNGAGDRPGLPVARAVLDLDALPPAAARVVEWHLGGDGSLGEAPPPAGAVAYRYDPSIRPPTSAAVPDLDVNAPDPAVDWRPLPVGHGLAFLGPELVGDQLLCGPSSLDLWLTCSAPDVDLEVTLTEVRPDGWETFVQSGWLRAGLRHLDPGRSTPLVPQPTYRAEDEAPLDPAHPAPARVPIPAVVHRLRAGSRLAVRVEPPGGVQPVWTFAALWPDGRHDGAPVVVGVTVGGLTPSVLRLPLLDLDGLLEPDELPPPGALRRQPSRPWWPGSPAVAASATT